MRNANPSRGGKRRELMRLIDPPQLMKMETENTKRPVSGLGGGGRTLPGTWEACPRCHMKIKNKGAESSYN